jgi:hypothetical protein
VAAISTLAIQLVRLRATKIFQNSYLHLIKIWYSGFMQPRIHIAVSDPRRNSGYPQVIDHMPNTKEGFMWWDSERREINEIHTTSNGVQIELIK